jgi:hypothetical protein
MDSLSQSPGPALAALPSFLGPALRPALPLGRVLCQETWGHRQCGHCCCTDSSQQHDAPRFTHPHAGFVPDVLLVPLSVSWGLDVTAGLSPLWAEHLLGVSHAVPGMCTHLWAGAQEDLSFPIVHWDRHDNFQESPHKEGLCKSGGTKGLAGLFGGGRGPIAPGPGAQLPYFGYLVGNAVPRASGLHFTTVGAPREAWGTVQCPGVTFPGEHSR